MAKSTRTAGGRTLSPENCSVRLSAAMLAENRRRGRAGEEPMTRFGNCDVRSAEYVLSQKPANAGRTFSGMQRRGIHPDADLVSHGAVPMSFWKNSLARASADIERPAPPSPEPAPAPSLLGRLLPYWPRGGSSETRHNPAGSPGSRGFVIERQLFTKYRMPGYQDRGELLINQYDANDIITAATGVTSAADLRRYVVDRTGYRGDTLDIYKISPTGLGGPKPELIWRLVRKI